MTRKHDPQYPAWLGNGQALNASSGCLTLIIQTGIPGIGPFFFKCCEMLKQRASAGGLAKIFVM
jgi:hypothetical protein